MDSPERVEASVPWLSIAVKLVAVIGPALALVLWVADLRSQVRTNTAALDEVRQSKLTTQLELLVLRVNQLEARAKDTQEQAQREALETAIRRALFRLSPAGAGGASPSP